MSTYQERLAEVEYLISRALNPDDEYDAHHGTDRSPESLEWAKENDPETYKRVTLKMAEGN